MPMYSPYQPYYNQYQNFYTQPQTQPIQIQTQPQTQIQAPIQNGGFVSVRSIDEARSWPVAPGNSVTFKDESAPYIYTKTMSYNQLDAPRFERFRLVHEEDAPQSTPTAPQSAPTINPSDYVTKAEFATLQGRIEVVENFIQTKVQTKIDKTQTKSTESEVEE